MGEFHEEVVVLTIHSVQRRWETVASRNLSIRLRNHVCKKYKITNMVKMSFLYNEEIKLT